MRRCFLDPKRDFTKAADRKSHLESRLSAEARREYDRIRQEGIAEYARAREKEQSQFENSVAEEMLQQRPSPPWEFSSQSEKRLMAERAVNIRMENKLADHRAKAHNREMEFLEREEKNRHSNEQPRQASPPEGEQQKLKDLYRRLADRRSSQDRRRDDGRGR